MARIFSFHKRQRSKSLFWRQTMYCFRAGSCGLLVRGRSKPRGSAEILPAVFAVAHAAARPAVGKDAVGLVHAHDLFMHGGHEFEVVGAESAGFPIARIGGVAHRLAVCIHPDPVWMRVIDLLPAGVRVGSRHDVHAHRAAAGQQVTEGIAIAEPRAALLQRNLGGIERHHAACAQAGCVGMNAAKVVEPELSDRSCRDRLRQTQAAPSAWAGRTSRLLRFEAAAASAALPAAKQILRHARRQQTSCCCQCRSLHEFPAAAHPAASRDSAISSHKTSSGKLFKLAHFQVTSFFVYARVR